MNIYHLARKGFIAGGSDAMVIMARSEEAAVHLSNRDEWGGAGVQRRSDLTITSLGEAWDRFGQKPRVVVVSYDEI